MTPAMTAHRAQLARELRDEEAARRWSEGKVNPERVTDVVILGKHGCAALVAGWGKYPTWEQLVDLARLGGVEPLWFVEG